MTELVGRHAEPVAREMLDHFPGLVIEGARQVGKSTLARQLVEAADSLYVTLDDDAVRDAAVADPAGFMARGKGRVMVIDEIQRHPELTLAVKASIDRDRRPGRFILTGSASLLRVRGLADSLAGRVGRLTLYGLSQGEILARHDDFVTAATDLGAFVDQWVPTEVDYAACIARGSYPEGVRLPDRMRRRWFDGYLSGVVRRDLGELRREVSPPRVEALLRALAGTQSGELVKATLAGSTEIPAATIASYVDLLTDVGLVTTLAPWTPNLRTREVGRRKALVTDSGLALHLTRLTQEQLGTIAYREAYGAMLEGLVTAELLKQQTWTATEFDLYHFRDRNGLEVDLVLELTGGRVLAIEVKASTSFTGGQFTALRTLRDALGDRFIGGVVLNTGDSSYRYADRLYGLPVSSLWMSAAPG
ncbi:MAG: ATP-binding protein [Dermatophilaceae bacterium]